MKNRFTNISIFVLTALIIGILLPTNTIFKYDYSYGSRWNKKTLTAPFGFPILKSQEEYAHDVEKYRQQYIPIFQADSLIGSSETAKFRKQYGLEAKPAGRIPESERIARQALQLIEECYRQGIIHIPAADSLNIRNGVIRVVDGGRLSVTDSNRFLSQKEAIVRIKNALFAKHPNDSIYINGINFNHFVVPNLRYNAKFNEDIQQSELKKIATTKGFVTKDEVIVTQGQIVDNETFNLLNSFKAEYKQQGGRDFAAAPVLSNLLFVFLLLAASYITLSLLHRNFCRHPKNVLFLCLLYVLLVAMTVIAGKDARLSVYLVPLAIFPFYLSLFFGIGVAISQFPYLLLLCAIVAPDPFEFFFINLVGGTVGAAILKDSYRRNTFFKALGAMLLAYFVSYCSVHLLQNRDIKELTWEPFFWFVLNGAILLALFQLVYIIEKIFRFVTRITLFELCDTNQFLLRKLAEKAPGTFQHSMQVANLAQEATKAIGGNDLLARTGALYHDIGKMENPNAFVENKSGDYNYHAKLKPEESAKFIRSHVTDGIKLARRNNIPSVVSDFILTHHGTSLIYYFYHEYKQQRGEVPDEEAFRYPGPNPSTKEETICMMADAIEAASRTLKEYTSQTISELIDTIVQKQMEGGQFRNSPLSFKEIEIVKEVFRTKLANIYHARIEYPK